ncbi:glycosyltransferase family 2 protein [Trichoderma citrinoviride]|uniref:chitin synthase n=1 Tax=Trichoderma citrinoviride TaxID=58853 RepID=A0A2T4BA10_9HYPO|nr:glycosyltransferase family 2 protein [Trichoderma citrinoviride]PTB66156.1 glycosyltransferase family 2 protein [Trichoderma citrinoviride]
MPVDSNPGTDSGDIATQRPTRQENFSKPPISMLNHTANNRLSAEQNSRDSSVIRNINGSFVPGTQTPQSQDSLGIVSASSFSSSIQQEEAKLRWDSDFELKRVSKSLLMLQKWLLILGLLCINGVLIFLALRFDQLYYLFIVLLSSNTMLQAGMMLAIIIMAILRRTIPCYFGRKEIIPDEPERLVLLLPCYNETREELTRSLDSLVNQKEIGSHPKVIFIVVDGNVRGPNMEKTTQEYLLEDILGPGQYRRFENGYRARDGLFMPVKVQTGWYKGLPYVLVGKSYNQGKRDSLCFARSFLYHFKQRSENVITMFNNGLYEYIGNIFVQHGLDTVDFLVGMDADTVFDQFCIIEMLHEIRSNPRLVGVCGHVCVDYDGKPFSPWSLYQSVEYSQTQGLRRMFQSRVTGKVNCLPGCCQLIRVDESTFGDEVLRERFGYCPKPNDVMTSHIMGNYSEDSIHASIIFSLFPKKQTAQALRAKAFTIVPQNMKVFLSQRKRWALGSISNEFVMLFRPGIIFVERVQSLVAVVTWAITPFIMAAVAELVRLFIVRGGKVFKDPVFVGLLSVLFARYFYSFCVGFWLPRNMMERTQYFVGFFLHFLLSPVINIVIMVYSLFNSDDFKWGKTREVVGEDDAEKGALVNRAPVAH